MLSPEQLLHLPHLYLLERPSSLQGRIELLEKTKVLTRRALVWIIGLRKEDAKTPLHTLIRKYREKCEEVVFEIEGFLQQIATGQHAVQVEGPTGDLLTAPEIGITPGISSYRREQNLARSIIGKNVRRFFASVCSLPSTDSALETINARSTGDTMPLPKFP